ncbi:MAG: nucleotidyltransferase family protein [Candidatus Omnitrophica bacterium]|nr:nucleotidyltransferase family protein [Candidatus Omnitrophota bacterium]
MGSPKPLLRLGSQNLLERILSELLLFDESMKPIVVLGHESDRIRSGVSLSFSWVMNPQYRKGRTTSVQCGLRALPPETDGAFIWPVDCPLAPRSVLKALASTFESADSICIPSYDFRRGHPPLIGAAYFPEILSMHENQSLRELYKNHPDQILHVTVDADAVLHNMNTREDFLIIREKYERNVIREQKP